MTTNAHDVIKVLLEWIENRLGERLSVDEIARKSGYSKWHMQRIFFNVTGMPLGLYTRGRRLSEAAMALRLTSRTILDIAMQYNFDSQQSFTRAFKKQFNETPARYRQLDDWHTAGIQPPFRLGQSEVPQPVFVRLDTFNLVGNIASYHCRLEEISENREKIRSDFWHKMLTGSKQIPPVIYGLHQVRPSLEKKDEQEVFYCAAVSEEYLTLNLNTHSKLDLEGGYYARFTYRGSLMGLQEFIQLLYNTCMPVSGLVRRQGQDIECYYTRQGAWKETLPDEIHCDYFIPVLSISSVGLETAQPA